MPAPKAGIMIYGMRTAAFAAVLSCVLWGCEKPKPKPEPTYQGKARSEWITLAGDRDAATRVEAYKALGGFRGADATTQLSDLLRNAVESEDDPLTKAAAAIAFFRSTGRAGPAVELIRTLLQGPHATETDRGRSCYAVKTIAEALGPAASPAAADLRKAKATIPPVPRSQLEAGFLDDAERAVTVKP